MKKASRSSPFFMTPSRASKLILAQCSGFGSFDKLVALNLSSHANLAAITCLDAKDASEATYHQAGMSGNFFRKHDCEFNSAIKECVLLNKEIDSACAEIPSGTLDLH